VFLSALAPQSEAICTELTRDPGSLQQTESNLLVNLLTVTLHRTAMTLPPS
jgi:hypothetical protein